MGKKKAGVVCCYKEDNAEQCEATMTLGMGSLCTIRASLADKVTSSFFTTLISTYKEQQRSQNFKHKAELPGVENIISLLAHTEFCFPFKAIFIPAPPPPWPWSCHLYYCCCRRRFAPTVFLRTLILTSNSEEIIDHPK